MEIKCTKGYIMNEIDNDLVLVPCHENTAKFKKMFYTSGVGADIICILNKKDDFMSIEEIADSILELYDVEKEVILKDIQNFIEKLIEAEIVVAKV